MLHEAFSARRDETGRFASSIDGSAMTRWWGGLLICDFAP